MRKTFTGKTLPKGVSLPEDMWAYLQERRENIGIPVSRFIQDAVIEKIERDTHPARVLVDTGATYETKES